MFGTILGFVVDCGCVVECREKTIHAWCWKLVQATWIVVVFKWCWVCRFWICGSACLLVQQANYVHETRKYQLLFDCTKQASVFKQTTISIFELEHKLKTDFMNNIEGFSGPLSAAATSAMADSILWPQPSFRATRWWFDSTAKCLYRVSQITWEIWPLRTMATHIEQSTSLKCVVSRLCQRSRRRDALLSAHTSLCNEVVQTNVLCVCPTRYAVSARGLLPRSSWIACVRC